MIKVLEGQISFGGMQDALESVTRHTHVKHGLVRVTSNTCSGLIGVFCGRIITGALITLTGETGIPALKRLLTTKDGSFALLDVSNEPVADVNQSLGIDLQALLSTEELSLDAVPRSEQSLTMGLGKSSDAMPVIDTDPGETPDLSPDRINQTYQRILALSQHLKAQTLDTGPPPTLEHERLAPPPERPQPAMQGRPEMLTDDMFYDEAPETHRRKEQWTATDSQEINSIADDRPQVRETIVSDTGNYAVIFDGAASGTAPKLKSTDEYKRLKDWGHKSLIVRRILWCLVIIGIGAVIYHYSADLAKIIGTVMAMLTKHK